MTPRDFLADENVPAPSSKLAPRDFLSENNPEESKLTSTVLAIPRIGEDVIKSGYNVIRNIPAYWESAQSNIPAALNTISQNPMGSLNQGIAGIAEAGQNIFNVPHDIANYATERLHLLPENINQKIQMGRMPESQNEINSFFGTPQNEGEQAIRWTGRNSLNLLSGLGAAKTLNPLQFTNKGIAKRVVNELKNQVILHNKKYNKLWKSAEKKGFNQVPYDRNALNMAPEIIEKFYPEKSVLGLKDFLENPTLEKAQKAQSDLGILRRALEEKAKTSPLLETEKGLHKVLYDTEKHIEENMFKNEKGQKNHKLANTYKKITGSYRENVVPYKYHPDIQAYLSKDITAKQLIQRLNQGPFAAKKGGFFKHPQFAVRNALLPVATSLGLLGGGKYLYDQALGNSVAEKK